MYVSTPREEDIVPIRYLDNEMKMLKVNIYTAVVGFFLAVVAPTALAEQRIHFFGNSYTSFSGGLEKMVRALLEESLSVTIYAKRTTRNGARLSTHLSYARE
jgi:hypothetical protein